MTEIEEPHRVSRKRRSRAFHRAMAAVEMHGRARSVTAPLTPSGSTRAEGNRAGRVETDIVTRIYRAMILAVQR